MNGLKIKPNSKNIAILCMIFASLLSSPLLLIVSTNETPIPQNSFEEFSPMLDLETNLTPKTAGVHLPIVDSPPDIWRRDGDAAYVEWNATDADVAPGEEAGYYTVNGSDGYDSPRLTWYSGVPLNFPIPMTEKDDNWTIYIYDNDENMVNDTIGTEWWAFEAHPLLESITIVQDGEEYDIKDKPYIETGKGSFELKLNWEDANIDQPFWWTPSPLHNPNRIRSVTTELRGYYPNFDFNFYIPALGANLQLHCDALTPDGYWVVLIPVFTLLSNHWINEFFGIRWTSLPPFTQSVDTHTLAIETHRQFLWRTWAWVENNPFFQQIFYKKVQDVEYRVTNKFKLFVETGNMNTETDYFVYDQKQYNTADPNNILEIDLENKDVNAPNCVSQNATQIDDTSNLNVVAEITDEFKGSGVDVDKVTLYYSINGAPWGSNRMLYVKEDGVFKGNIAPPGPGASVSYYIEMYDMEGNVRNSEIYSYVTPAREIPPVVITLIGIVVVAVGAVTVTIIYRKRNQPAIITLPSKKKVDKYYKKINKEEG